MDAVGGHSPCSFLQPPVPPTHPHLFRPASTAAHPRSRSFGQAGSRRLYRGGWSSSRDSLHRPLPPTSAFAAACGAPATAPPCFPEAPSRRPYRWRCRRAALPPLPRSLPPSLSMSQLLGNLAATPPGSAGRRPLTAWQGNGPAEPDNPTPARWASRAVVPARPRKRGHMVVPGPLVRHDARHDPARKIHRA
jgi:hypothetical protein